MLGRLLNKRMKNAQKNLKNVENRDLMEAIVGADGEFEDKEVVVIKEVAGKLGLNPTDYGLPT